MKINRKAESSKKYVQKPLLIMQTTYKLPFVNLSMLFVNLIRNISKAALGLVYQSIKIIIFMKRTVISSILLLSHFVFSQSFNKLTTDQKGNELLLGEISKSDLTQNTFNSWFSKNYDAYLVNKSITKQLKDSLKIESVNEFAGTYYENGPPSAEGNTSSTVVASNDDIDD